MSDTINLSEEAVEIFNDMLDTFTSTDVAMSLSEATRLVVLHSEFDSGFEDDSAIVNILLTLNKVFIMNTTAA